MKIDWTLPKRRPGFGGFIDKFIGPGATTAEKDLQLYPALLFGVGVVVHANATDVGWTVGQYIAAFVLAVDMLGGMATNATSSAKRWFFREGQGFAAHMTFIGVHLVQATAASFFFLDFDVAWIAMVYGTLILSCAGVLKTPLYLQRPLATLLFAGALLLSIYVFAVPHNLAWFLPLFFFKLLISHALREEPYRPELEELPSSLADSME